MFRLHTFLFLGAVLLALGVAVQPAAAALIDFNTPGDLAGNFTVNQSSTTYTEVNSIGLGNPTKSRAISLRSDIWMVDTNATMVYNPGGGTNGAIDLSNGQTVTMSGYLFYGKTDYTSNALLKFGLQSDTNGKFNGTYALAELRIYGTSDGDGSEVGFDKAYYMYKQTGGTGGFSSYSTYTKTLDENMWYKMTTNLRQGTGVDAGKIVISATLDECDLNGNVTTAGFMTMPEFTFTTTNALATDSTTYATAYASMPNNKSSGGAFDNFYVPEPATMALLAIGGVGMLIRRRRR
jgi:hypothetical protein